MNKTELVDHISAHTEMTKVDAASALEAVLDGIATALKNGDDVRLAGFGAFSVKHRAETNTNGYSLQPTCAQSRMPMDRIVSGACVSFFHASHAASTIAS